MLESVLEKILLNNFGEIIQGLDKSNLKIGVWQGNIVIRNVSVRPEILNRFELPIFMLFSHIGKLELKVPLSSLGSKPVEVILENVFMIFSQTNEKEWKPIDYASIGKRLEVVETFAKEYLQKVLEKEREQNKQDKAQSKDDQGLVARMTEKVLDNLQITIRNIHVRFESGMKKSFSFGFTLDQVLLYTTNEKWEKEYIDRTDAKNKFLPLCKVLSLKSAGLYWESDANMRYLQNLDKDKIIECMTNIILKQNQEQGINQANTMSMNMNSSSQENSYPYPDFNKNFIISISAGINLTQNNRKNPSSKDKPEIDVNLSLKPIDINIHKRQLEDLIGLLEYFNKYKMFKIACMKEAKAKTKNLIPDEVERLKSEFKDLYSIYVAKTEKKAIKSGDEKMKYAFNDERDIQRFRVLLAILPDEHLVSAVKIVIREHVKENKVKEIKEQTQSKLVKKGIMGFLSRAQNINEGEITAQEVVELKKLEEKLEAIFNEDKEENENQQGGLVSSFLGNALNEISYKKLIQVTFTLQGGLIYFSNLKENGDEEGVEMSYSGLQTHFYLTSKSMFLHFLLSELKVSLKTKYKGHKNYIYFPILKRAFDNNTTNTLTDPPMLSIKFEQNPQGKDEGSYYTLECTTVEFIYSPLASARLKQFFDVQTEDEYLIARAIDFSEDMQDKAKESIKQIIQNTIKNYINVKISSPVMIIPFMQNGDLQSQCWIMNLGDLEIVTKHSEDIENRFYEWYDICLKNIKMQYYPTQALYLKLKEGNSKFIPLSNPDSPLKQNISASRKTLSSSSKPNPIQSPTSLQEEEDEIKKIFTLIQDFCITGDIKLKSKYYKNDGMAQNKPNMILAAKISDINLNLSQTIYNYILRTQEFIMISKDNPSIEFVETEKNRLLSSNIKIGFLYIREKKYNEYVWNRYHIVFSGAYLHFFKSPLDKRATCAIYIKGAKLDPMEHMGQKYAFLLENRYNKAYLACEDEKNRQVWLDVIRNRLADFSSTEVQDVFDAQLKPENLALEYEHLKLKESKTIANKDLGEEVKDKGLEDAEDQSSAKDIKHHIPLTMIEFSVDCLRLNLVDNTGKVCLDLESRQFSSSFCEYPSKMSIKAKLHSLEIDDKTYIYHNPNLQKFLTSTIPISPLSSPNILTDSIQQQQQQEKHQNQHEQKNLGEITIDYLKKDHPEWKINRTQVNIYVKFGYLCLNFKPQLIEFLIVFLVPNREKGSNVVGGGGGEANVKDNKIQNIEIGNKSILRRMQKELPSENQEKSTKTIYTDKNLTLMNIQFNLEEFKVKMVHRLTYVCLFDLKVTQTSIWIIVKPNIIEVKGKLGNLQLIDMSGYPFTEDSNHNYHLIKPYEIIGLGEVAENLAEFSFISYDAESELIDQKERVFNKLTLEFYHLRFNYIQQITERIINYLDAQILFLSDIDLDSSGASFKPIKLTENIAKFIIEYPSFFQLKATIKNPIITLKPTPTSEDYIELNIKDIFICTNRTKNTTRYKNPSSILDFVYTEIYKINFNNVIVNKVTKAHKTRISNEFNSDITFERLLFTDVYEYLYNQHGKFELDTTFIIKGKFTPIILMITRPDYLLIMKAIFYNIAYDDMMDMLYVYNFNQIMRNKPCNLHLTFQSLKGGKRLFKALSLD